MNRHSFAHEFIYVNMIFHLLGCIFGVLVSLPGAFIASILMQHYTAICIVLLNFSLM